MATSGGRRIGTTVLLGLTIPMLLLVATGRVEPIQLLHPGRAGPSSGLVEEAFGPDAFLRDDVGYDGQQFWVIADTFPDLDAAAPGLDDPSYRLQRITQPALAAVAGGGSASALALVLLTYLGAALCCAGLADLAQRYGRPAWLGYLALVPLLYAIALVTSEPLAYGLGFVGLCFADRDRHVAAALCITLGALTRETAALFVVAAALPLAAALLRRQRRFSAAWLTYGLVAVVPVLWGAYLRSRFEVGYTEQRILLLGLGRGTAGQFALGAIGVAACAVGVVRWRDAAPLALTAATFGALALVLGTDVLEPWHFFRVVAPGVAIGLAGLAAGLSPRRAARA
jgi:hypothetical protein